MPVDRDTSMSPLQREKLFSFEAFLSFDITEIQEGGKRLNCCTEVIMFVFNNDHMSRK